MGEGGVPFDWRLRMDEGLGVEIDGMGGGRTRPGGLIELPPA